MHIDPGFWACELSNSRNTVTGRDTVNGISTIMLTTNSNQIWSGEREHIEQACTERISSWRAGSRRRQGEETFLTIFFIFISDRSTNFVIVIVISKSRKKQEEIWKEKRK